MKAVTLLRHKRRQIFQVVCVCLCVLLVHALPQMTTAVLWCLFVTRRVFGSQVRFASDGVVMDVDFAEINYDMGMDEGEEPAQGPAADVGQLDSVFDTVDTGRGETDSTMMSSATPGTDGPSTLQQQEQVINAVEDVRAQTPSRL